MKATPSACGMTDRNLELLEGKLSSEEESAWENHLEQCATCRGRLKECAAEPESWSEATQFLGFDPYRNSIGDRKCGSRSSSHSIENVLRALTPTDDPNMLGRLGGYEVSGVIGSGGMGVVLKALDCSLDRIIAIKVLAPHLASSGSARRRFAREAKAAAAVLHPNVVAIHGVSNDESLPYLVMPYVRGESLQKRIDREGPLPVIDILRIASQIASGLSAAHEQGLVHRDIKPANILLEDGVERVAITDFGLARAVDDATMTRSGVIAGTPQYMSPEQAKGESIGARSDLFSLGSVIYAMCTGRSPFRAETSYGVLHRIVQDQPRSILDINPNVPSWLCRLVERLHCKNADERICDAKQLESLLTQCIAHVEQPTQSKLPQELRENETASWPTRTKLVWISLTSSLLIIACGWLAVSRAPTFHVPRKIHVDESIGDGIEHRSHAAETRQAVPTDQSKAADSIDATDWNDEALLDAELLHRDAMMLETESRRPFADLPLLPPTNESKAQR
ncbi:serine/threonine-protein kinase [Novipirellula artificiosorum]|uniref:non-specific serine/threonine protein kinase n=1 Tax=Novipirellula artificiosorum TaxID=2528016 RepID=A0A5C6DQH8_9BACT|nr:serine/threonine-protein kinase [Novipirellula artificiosorum]TWU39533.1 Serine/threonine-protein kinase PrkC [Novipirellula artificiosorum]